MQSIAKPAFTAIRHKKLYEQVARKLERFIVYKRGPGDKLPSERELSIIFKVSRSSIRDAVRELEALELVEVRPGIGAVIRDASVAQANPLLLQKRRELGELLEVRSMIEPALAARAAVNSTAEQLALIEEILHRHGQKVRQRKMAIAEDSEFHYAIARAANNSVLLKVLDTLMHLLRDTRKRSLQVEGRLERSYEGHLLILAALKRRDAAEAETAMRQHLQDIRHIVCSNSSDQKGEELEKAAAARRLAGANPG
jgi:GntR family transcriptional repressor for pyruvate dehydrogenase complex